MPLQCNCNNGSWDGVVGITTCYGLDGWVKTEVGNEISTPLPSGPKSHRSTQLLALFCRGTAAGAWHWPATPNLALRLKKGRAVPHYPHVLLLACCWVKFVYSYNNIIDVSKCLNEAIHLKFHFLLFFKILSSVYCKGIMKEICLRLPVENVNLLFVSTLHLSQVTHLCIVHMHNVHPSVLLRYKGATSCILAAVMQAVKHEIIFLYFCYTLGLCIHSGSAITDLKVQPFLCLPLIFSLCSRCITIYKYVWESTCTVIPIRLLNSTWIVIFISQYTYYVLSNVPDCVINFMLYAGVMYT